MGLDSQPQTGEDYAAYFYTFETIQNDGARLRGWPNLDTSNPPAGSDNIIGGVKLRGYNSGYANDNGVMDSEQEQGDPGYVATNPAPPSGSDDDADSDDANGMDSVGQFVTQYSPPSAQFWICAIAIAILLYVALKHGVASAR
jgi:hypothetical protein